MDALQLVKFLEERQREDEDRRRIEDVQQMEEFSELLGTLTFQQLLATPVTLTQPSKQDTQPGLTVSAKAVIHPPPPSLPDINIQVFWDWCRKELDSATKINLPTISTKAVYPAMDVPLPGSVAHGGILPVGPQ